MAFIPFENTVQAVVRWAINNIPLTNTLHFRKADFTFSDMEAMGTWLFNHFAVYALPDLCDNTALQGITIYDLTSENAPVFVYDPTPNNGDVVGDPAPASAALVVTFRTATRGRSGRGRNYVAGFAEADTGGHTVDNATRVAQIENCYVELISRAQNEGWTWVVASRYAGGAPRALGVTYPITSAVARNAFFGTQRRRIDRP